MRNKILLLLVCAVTVLTFSACKIEKPSGNVNIPGGNEENENAIYGEGIKTYIVIDGSDSEVSATSTTSETTLSTSLA